MISRNAPQTATHEREAFGALFLASLAWSIAPVWGRMLHETYEPHVFTAYRFAVATLPLLLVSYLRYPADLARAFRNWRGIGAITVLNVIMQYSFAAGILGSTATQTQLITKLSVVFVIVFSFFLYHEERGVILHPLFMVGTAVSFVGLVLVLAEKPGSLLPVLTYPTLMLVVAALLWGVYNVWSKHLVTNIHPVPMFAVLALYTALAYMGILTVAGGAVPLSALSGREITVTILVGVVPLGLGHASYNYAQKYLGASFASSFTLLLPLFTWLLALVMIPSEKLQMIQLLGGLVLMAGTGFVTYARREVRPRTVPAATNAEA